MRQLETRSRLFRGTYLLYKHNFHVPVSLNGHLCDEFANFGLILKTYLVMVARLSYDSRKTFVRVSHDYPTNVALVSFSFVRQARDIRASFARHTFEYRLVLFSHQIGASCSHVF